MSIQKPYHRFYRPFVGDKMIRLENYGYVSVRDYAEQAELYIRSFNMIQDDVKRRIGFRSLIIMRYRTQR